MHSYIFPPIEHDRDIGDYVRHSVLGRGHSSTVYCCFRTKHQQQRGGLKQTMIRDGNSVAFKTIDKMKISCLEDVLKVEREIKALSLLSPHQNVVRYYHTLHGKLKIYILMECFPSDLVRKIRMRSSSSSSSANDSLLLPFTPSLLSPLIPF